MMKLTKHQKFLKKTILFTLCNHLSNTFKSTTFKRINYLKKYTNKVGFSDHSLGYGSKRNLASLLAIYMVLK